MIIFPKDTIEDVIDEMKSSGTIISASESDGTWTIGTSDTGNLKDYFKVKIGSSYYRVSNVDTTFENSFDVVTSDTITTEMTWEMYINFQFGYPKEVIEIVQRKGMNQKKDEKFDLIWLFGDMPQKTPIENELIDKEVDITISIVTNSKQNYTIEERITNKLERILNPLFELFKNTLEDSTAIIINRGEKLAIEKHFRPNYAVDEKNVFGENTDAIEFKLTINIKKVFNNENIK